MHQRQQSETETVTVTDTETAQKKNAVSCTNIFTRTSDFQLKSNISAESDNARAGLHIRYSMVKKKNK